MDLILLGEQLETSWEINNAPGVSSQCKIRAKMADLSIGAVGVRPRKQEEKVAGKGHFPQDSTLERVCLLFPSTAQPIKSDLSVSILCFSTTEKNSSQGRPMEQFHHLWATGSFPLCI